MWRKNEMPILSDKMCDQTLLVKGKFDANILQYVRLTLDMPKPTRNRQMGPQCFQLIPTVHSAVRISCKFQQTGHTTFVRVRRLSRSRMFARATKILFWKLIAEHGKAALGSLARGFVLNHIPVFGQKPVLNTQYVCHNPVHRLAHARESPVPITKSPSATTSLGSYLRVDRAFSTSLNSPSRPVQCARCLGDQNFSVAA